MRQVLAIALLLCASTSLVAGVTLWGWEDFADCLGPPTERVQWFVMPEVDTDHNCTVLHPNMVSYMSNPGTTVCQEGSDLPLNVHTGGDSTCSNPPTSFIYLANCYYIFKRKDATATSAIENMLATSETYRFKCVDTETYPLEEVKPYVKYKVNATCPDAPPTSAAFLWSNVPGECVPVYNSTSNEGPVRWTIVDYPCMATDSEFSVPLYTADDCSAPSFERIFSFDLGEGCQVGGYTAECYGIPPPVDTPVAAPVASTPTPESSPTAPVPTSSPTPVTTSPPDDDNPEDGEPDAANALSFSLFTIIAIIVSSLIFF